jgi:type IV secretion system protein VirD4
MRDPGERHVLVFGPNGSGKGTRLLIPNLLQLEGRSIFVIDPKGELAAVTAQHRQTVGDVVIINPFGILADRPGYEHLKSRGFNPLTALDPTAPSFNSDTALLAEALIKTEGAKDPHWDDSARALVAALIMYVCAEGLVLKKVPTLDRVRELLCSISKEPTERHPQGVGIPKLAHEMMESGLRGLQNKASQFTDWNKEIQGIASTAKRQTEFLDDDELADDLSKVSMDFRELKDRPITVYLILPPQMMTRHGRWLRLLLTSALNACMRERRPGEPRVLFMLDEFAALGHLQIIETVWALVRGYGIQIMPILQDLNQLKGIYHERWETFIGMAGTVLSFGPNDHTTADWLSRRAGETTKVIKGYNQGASHGGHDSTSTGLSWQQVKMPLLPAHNLFGMAPGETLIALAGLSNIVAGYAPGYYEIARCVERADPNPYYHG